MFPTDIDLSKLTPIALRLSEHLIDLLEQKRHGKTPAMTPSTKAVTAALVEWHAAVTAWELEV